MSESPGPPARFGRLLGAEPRSKACLRAGCSRRRPGRRARPRRESRPETLRGISTEQTPSAYPGIRHAAAVHGISATHRRRGRGRRTCAGTRQAPRSSLVVAAAGLSAHALTHCIPGRTMSTNIYAPLMDSRWFCLGGEMDEPNNVPPAPTDSVKFARRSNHVDQMFAVIGNVCDCMVAVGGRICRFKVPHNYGEGILEGNHSSFYSILVIEAMGWHAWPTIAERHVLVARSLIG